MALSPDDRQSLRQTPFTHLQGAPGLPTAPPYLVCDWVAGGVVDVVGDADVATEGAVVVEGWVTVGAGAVVAGAVTVGCVTVVVGATGAGRAVVEGVLTATGGWATCGIG